MISAQTNWFLKLITCKFLSLVLIKAPLIFVVEYVVRGSYQKRGEKSRVFYKQVFLLCFSNLSFCNGDSL